MAWSKRNSSMMIPAASGLPRRKFIQYGGAALGAACTGGMPAWAQAAGGELLVSNWGGDWNSNVINALEQPELEKDGIRVLRDLAAAPARKTKILAERNLPRGSVDIAHFTDADAYELNVQGALEELDYSKIPNAKHLLPGVQKPYFIPFYISGVVLIYNKNKIKTPPNSFADLLNPAYAGKVGLIDQIYFNYFLAMGLLNGGTMANAEPAFDKLRQLKQAVQPRIYPSHQQAAAALASEEIWITANYNARAAQWKADGLPVEAAYPKEGAIAFEGGVCMPKRARNKDNAYRYLNAMLLPSVAQKIGRSTYYAVPIDNANLPPELQAIDFTPAQRKSLNRLDLGYTAKSQSTWLEWWNKEIKV